MDGAPIFVRIPGFRTTYLNMEPMLVLMDGLVVVPVTVMGICRWYWKWGLGFAMKETANSADCAADCVDGFAGDHSDARVGAEFRHELEVQRAGGRDSTVAGGGSDLRQVRDRCW